MVKIPMTAPTIMCAVVVAVAIFGSSCSSGDSDPEDTFSKIKADQTIRDLSSFEKAPFKMSKEYDVSALPMGRCSI